MKQLIATLLKPDNMPVAAMFVVLFVLLGLWWREARKHDRRIEEGCRDRIGEDMRR